MDLLKNMLQFCGAIGTFTIVCVGQIDCAMDGWVAACQAAPRPDRLCDGWLGGRLPSGAWTLSLHIIKVSWGSLGSQ